MPDRPSGPSAPEDEGATRDEWMARDEERTPDEERARDEEGTSDHDGSPHRDTMDERGASGAAQSGTGTDAGVPRAGTAGARPEREPSRPTPEPGTTAATGSRRPTGWLGFVYDVATSVLAVALVGAFLFAVSGVWPPLVAVESGSMVPNMHEGDLVFVMEEHRFAGSGAVGDTGVVTAAGGAATDYRTFGGFGDVVVYAPDGNANRTPIIHRAMLWVEDGERWYDEADPDAIPSHVNSCTQLQYCPAPHAGFITKGDHNDEYDQANGLSAPVRPEWVVGTAEIRLPGLGWIRLGSR